MKWPLVPLGSVITLQRGYDLTEEQRKDGNIPVVTSSGITGWHNVAAEKGPGVITGRCGTIGEVHYVEQDYWPHNTALFVSDFKKTLPQYTRYLLMYLKIDQQVSTGAVPGVNRNFLHAMLVPDIPTPYQQKISDVLGTYDRLIENNQHRVQILDELARHIYDEWFIRHTFPSCYNSNSNNGLYDCWEGRSLNDICPEVRESIGPNYLKPDMPYVGLEHIPRRLMAIGKWGNTDEVTSTKLCFQPGDILFAKIRPYLHKVGVTFNAGVTSSDAIVLRPKSEMLRPFCLLTVSSDVFVAEASQTANDGAKMPRADWGIMGEKHIPVPKDDVLKEFNRHIEPILDQMKILTFSSRLLINAKDILLPRLFNGEITL